MLKEGQKKSGHKTRVLPHQNKYCKNTAKEDLKKSQKSERIMSLFGALFLSFPLLKYLMAFNKYEPVFACIEFGIFF